IEEIIPSTVFLPKPKVDSAIIKLLMRKDKAVPVREEKLLIECIHFGFAKRRKTLLNSMTGIQGLDKNTLVAIFSKLTIDSGRRGETLNLEEYSEIANEIFLHKTQ
ncbi:MAG: rRNA adenine N-6-methyltransferase family protein, partial [Anaerovoracaceae bacterium]